MRMDKRFLWIVVIALTLNLFGCCSFLDNTVDKRPFVSIKMNQTEGPAPFNDRFTYRCYDPNDRLLYCELRIDDQIFANANTQEGLLPEGFVYPDYYVEVMNTPGEHALEIYAVNKDGFNASAKEYFRVTVPSEPLEHPQPKFLSGPGWYTCNNISVPPCGAYQSVYCDKFSPEDIEVRKAAAEAISKHPGAFSINQLLDVYDWVHTNVFYQNVPVNLTYQPYTPSETLRTKSGDCKNQAVLIASMVEAIGGSARVLLIPECQHAFTEVYVGKETDLDPMFNAIYAHYGSKAPNIVWHYSNNKTENWLIFDTAGGSYPGSTIDACKNASTTYVIYDCSKNMRDLNPPAVTNVEYGPFPIFNERQVVEPNTWRYYTPNVIGSEYRLCRYQIELDALSSRMSWYIIPDSDYEAFRRGDSYTYYTREENVMNAKKSFDWQGPGKFKIITRNYGTVPITVQISVNSTCYT